MCVSLQDVVSAPLARERRIRLDWAATMSTSRMLLMQHVVCSRDAQLLVSVTCTLRCVLTLAITFSLNISELAKYSGEQ